jgi:hypothetical protein
MRQHAPAGASGGMLLTGLALLRAIIDAFSRIGKQLLLISPLGLTSADADGSIRVTCIQSSM